jgi:hypothetical protein
LQEFFAERENVLFIAGLDFGEKIRGDFSQDWRPDAVADNLLLEKSLKALAISSFGVRFEFCSQLLYDFVHAYFVLSLTSVR